MPSCRLCVFAGSESSVNDDHSLMPKKSVSFTGSSEGAAPVSTSIVANRKSLLQAAAGGGYRSSAPSVDKPPEDRYSKGIYHTHSSNRVMCYNLKLS